jgi:hypothetical protein
VGRREKKERARRLNEERKQAPEDAPDRDERMLEAFLGLIFGTRVRIVKVNPNESACPCPECVAEFEKEKLTCN